MARKRVVEPSGVKTWEDANDALRQIAEAQLALADIEGEMNKQILGAKKAAEEQSKPYKDRVAKLERELKDFVTEHRADMGKTKTRALTFGEVGFRLSTSVSLPRAKEKIEEIIRRLKTRQMMDCIVVKEDVSKEALKKYGEDTVNAVGATWKQQDVFGYQNREAVILHEAQIADAQKEIKVLKDATLNNMTNNVFLINFDSVNSVAITSGIYDPVARKLYV